MKIYITADPGCSCQVVQKEQGEIPNPPLAPPQIPVLSPAKLCSLTLAKPKSQVLPYRNCKSYICQYLPYQTNCLHDLQLALCSRMHTLCLGYLASASRPSGHVSYGKWACDLDLTWALLCRLRYTSEMHDIRKQTNLGFIYGDLMICRLFIARNLKWQRPRLSVSHHGVSQGGKTRALHRSQLSTSSLFTVTLDFTFTFCHVFIWHTTLFALFYLDFSEPISYSSLDLLYVYQTATAIVLFKSVMFKMINTFAEGKNNKIYRHWFNG